jgi:2-dehydropantoate 2-reductase
MVKDDVFTVIGAGGIGCAVGWALAEAGADVEFVEADEQKVRWGRSHGVVIEGLPARRASFVNFHDWRPRECAAVLLCTKCYDNVTVLAKLSPTQRIVPIQNGFDRRIARRGPALEGIASFVSECRPGQTRTRITRGGKLHIGRRGLMAPAVSGPAVRFPRRCAPFRPQRVADVLPYKYTKLMYNAAISPVAAAAGLDNGELLSVATARHIFFALLQENYRILRHAGAPLGKIGPFHPDLVSKILKRRAVARALGWAFYPTLRKTYCSMSGDLPAGRSEIDFYNLHLIEIAGDHPCHLNRRVYDLVKRMERERIRPGRHVLDDLL